MATPTVLWIFSLSDIYPTLFLSYVIEFDEIDPCDTMLKYSKPLRGDVNIQSMCSVFVAGAKVQ